MRRLLSDGRDSRVAAARSQAGLIEAPIIIDAKSGVSGAGKTPTERTHFSECHGSISAYGVFEHRHAAEIEQELGTAVTFVPHLLPIDRGILETIYARAAPGRRRGRRSRRRCSRPTPIRRSCGSPARDLPEIKHVAHTNFCDIGWRVDEAAPAARAGGCLDNLVKGPPARPCRTSTSPSASTKGSGSIDDACSSSAASCSRTRRRCDAPRPASPTCALGPVAVVHGGGRAIDADLRARGKAPRFVDGLRITDADTLETVVSVLAGRINTRVRRGVDAAGVQAPSA